MIKLKKFYQSDHFNHFFHFFAVFTGIFVVMTIIILQIMRFGVYSSVDSSLETVSKQSNLYASRTMERITSFYFYNDSALINPSEFKAKLANQPVTNTDIILFSSNGTVINALDTFSNFHHFTLDKSQLNEIVTKNLENFYGRQEKFHTITVPVHSKNYPAVAYMMAVANVQQLEIANERYEQIIIIVMVLFWTISVFASIYLANWSRKPILESYEKQKMFVENASHELRTPLAVLQNRLETLFRKPNESILANSEAIASSLEEVRNMRILTTNLLNLARRDDGIAPRYEPIDQAYFETIFNNYHLIAEEYGKTFSAKVEMLHPFKGDKALLKQLVTILFDNAMKYTDKDGQVMISIRSSEKNLFIQVADNGPGIRDEDKEKIFDRFYRVDKARTRQKGGFGLGLALAKQIVTALKGSIKVRDNQPQGTVFDVRV
ncbi:sensor histidine kinase [Streptococcus halichoeri]|uniref:sensor histidine kinase n=1 Tax=Streptococcus halichoeri TaxID=254785 RepID=UPI00135B6CD3|nr:HAMP domain-containing sensor histidine kinase [Streptococcus halichoeri]